MYISHTIGYIVYIIGRGVLVIMIRNVHSKRSLHLNEAVCISHCANTIGKGTDSTILPSFINKSKVNWAL